MKLAVAPGHSTIDPGAVAADGTTEYSWALEFAGALVSELVLLGHDADLLHRPPRRGGLSALVATVNRGGYAAYIECHANSGPPTATGHEVLYAAGSTRGKRLATECDEAIGAVLGTRARGLKALAKGDRGAYQVSATSMPCVLLEPFFVSNPAELALATDRVCRLARGVAEAIDRWVRE